MSVLGMDSHNSYGAYQNDTLISDDGAIALIGVPSSDPIQGGLTTG